MNKSQNEDFGIERYTKESLNPVLVNHYEGSSPTSSMLFDNLVQMKNDRWLNSAEAADYLRLSVNALRIAVCRGQINAYKLGRRLRFKLSELSQLPNVSGCFPGKGV